MMQVRAGSRGWGDVDSERKEEKRAFGGEQKRESLCSGEI